MRGLLRPFLVPLLRRAPDEVERAAQYFSVESGEGKAVVAGVGRAFLGGYHAMLAARGLGDVSTIGRSVDAHHRPFFFEGAAMGYLPRAYFTPGAGRHLVESDLLAMDPRFLYLYNVGLGFWFGFRHPRRPEALEALVPHLESMYFPLCYDGFGFKVGFFDFPERPAARLILGRAPSHRRAPIYQGFGRALFFVCMEDESRFQREKDQVPAEHRNDLESGRALAFAFNHIGQAERLSRHLAAANDDDRASRLLGVTWALTAREMNDPEHFERCLAPLPQETQELFRLCPRLCQAALGVSADYAEWRSKTTDAVVPAYHAFLEGSRR